MNTSCYKSRLVPMVAPKHQYLTDHVTVGYWLPLAVWTPALSISSWVWVNTGRRRQKHMTAYFSASGTGLVKIKEGKEKITCRFHLLGSELVPFYCSLTDNQLDQVWGLHTAHFQHFSGLLQWFIIPSLITIFTLRKLPIFKIQIPKDYHVFSYTVRIGLLECFQVELKAETFTMLNFS